MFKAATFSAMLLLADGSLDHWITIAGQWAMHDDVLVCEAAPGVIRTTFESDHYVLEFDYRLNKDAEAWIALNSRMTTGGDQFKLTRRGIIAEYGDANRWSADPVSPETWLHADIEVDPHRIHVATSAEGKSIEGFQHDTIKYSRGFIRFETLQPGLEIRNLRVTEPDFLPMFDGETLNGWEIMYPKDPNDPGWVMRDGEVVCRGRRSSWLRSSRTYDNYVLRLEYNLPPRGNSGIFQRAPITGRCSRIGFEIQLLDDYSFYGQLRPAHHTGSIYDGVAPEVRVPTPAQTWNAIEVHCEGQRIRTTLNGVELYDVRLDDPGLVIDERIRPLAHRQTRGFIGLQDHNHEVRFRNVRLREIGEDESRETR